MKRLPCHDVVNRLFGERSLLGRADHAVKTGPIAKQGLGRLAHGVVRLDGVDGVAVVEKQSARNASPRADVCHDGGGRKSGFVRQHAQDARRIARPVAYVILDASAESLRGINVCAETYSAFRQLARFLALRR